jgi:hypothetical protein
MEEANHEAALMEGAGLTPLSAGFYKAGVDRPVWTLQT